MKLKITVHCKPQNKNFVYKYDAYIVDTFIIITQITY